MPGSFATQIDNPLITQSDWTARVATCRALVIDALLDRLAPNHNRTLARRGEHADELSALIAAALVLRCLDRRSWTCKDVELLDKSLAAAFRADLFADEFEEARPRIRESVTEAAKYLHEQPSELRGSADASLFR